MLIILWCACAHVMVCMCAWFNVTIDGHILIGQLLMYMYMCCYMYTCTRTVEPRYSSHTCKCGWISGVAGSQGNLTNPAIL